MTSVSEHRPGKIFFRKGVAAFGVNILSALLMFGLHILLARLMGEAFYGIYIYALTWLLIVTLIAKLGFDTALVRYIPMFSVSGEWGKMRGILNRSFFLCLTIGVFLSVVVIVITSALGGRIAPDLKSTLLIGALLVPVLGLVHLLQASLRGLKQVPKNELPDRIIRPMLMGGAIVFLASKPGEIITSELVMGVHLLAVFIAGIIATIWLLNAVPSECRLANHTFETRQWLTTAIPLGAFSAMHMLLANIDVLMIGSLSGTHDSGIYAVAARIAVFTIFALTAVNAIAAPVITELYEKGDFQGLQAMLTKYARINAVFALLATGVFYIISEYVLQWFGVAFPIAYTALIILCIGHVINALAGSVGFLLIMTGHEKQALYILGLTVAVNIAFNAFMIPLWGITGAAIATALSTTFWNFVMWAYARRKLKLDTAAILIPL